MLLTADDLKIGDLVKHRNDFGYLEQAVGLRYFVEWFVADSEYNLGRSTENDASIVLLREDYLKWETQNMK